MPVRPFTSDAEVVRFAEEFLDEHRKRFEKDIAICLKANDENSHAYFPALITCIGFLDLLSGLFAGTLEWQRLPELKNYAHHFMSPEYTPDCLEVLYECFRHKVAHLALPYVVFDTNTKPEKFHGRPRRLITWIVHDSGPRPPIKIDPVRGQILSAATPWPVFYDHIAVISIDGFASDIVESIPKYLHHLQKDNTALSRFRTCMSTTFIKS
jgi:hypothetical protein